MIIDKSCQFGFAASVILFEVVIQKLAFYNLLAEECWKPRLERREEEADCLASVELYFYFFYLPPQSVPY